MTSAANGLVRGGFKVRQAAHNDAEAIAALRLASWRHTYSGVVNESVFERHQARLADTAEAIRVDMDHGGYHWLVVDRAGDIVGWAHAGAARDADAPTPLELHAIYLLPAAQGSGIANRLLLTAIGDADCYLWVLEGNQRAHAFYRREGFAADGARRSLPESWGDLGEIRMLRRAGEDAD